MDEVIAERFSCEIIYDDKNAFVDFAAVELTVFADAKKKNFDSPSEMLEFFYTERDAKYHIMQKSADLRRLITNNIERLVKKHDIQQKTIKEIENRDIWRLYGELITANIYAVKKGMKSFSTVNFYDENAEITITLDEHLTPSENAQKYFKRYNKEKRTFEALLSQIAQTAEELHYLEGVYNAAISSSDEADLDEIRAELANQGLAKKRHIKKGAQKQKKAKPIKYVSSDDFEIYVGKSNTQNDELTLHFALPDDIWLHTKDIPGSHVIIRADGKTPPDRTLEEAAQLAAFFSKARESTLVPVDYTTRRNVKKPNGARPGMVIYNNYKTIFITPSESNVGIGKL